MTPEAQVEESVTENKYDKVLIFLHGVGGSGQEWPRFWQKIIPKNTKLILPTAPRASVALYGGVEMTSWYNMYDRYTSDLIEVHTMSKKLQQIVNEEIENGIDSKNIIISGFSQGGALALYTLMTSVVPLAGCIVLSSYILAGPQFLNSVTPIMNKLTPILLCHGMQDNKVPISSAQYSFDVLSKLCSNVKLKKYQGLGHDINEALQHDLEIYISQIFNKE